MEIKDIKPNISQIMACPLFFNMKEDEIEAILSMDDGVNLIEAGEGSVLDIGRMYVILSGMVIIEKEASDGRIVIMSKAKAPSAINVAAPLQKTSFSRLLVGESALLIEIQADTVKKALYKGGTFAVNFAAFLTNRISFLNHKITSLSGYSAQSRLELYIEENKNDGKVVITDNLSKFAEYLGVGRASLYRAFDILEASGKIIRKGRTLIINE